MVKYSSMKDKKYSRKVIYFTLLIVIFFSLFVPKIATQREKTEIEIGEVAPEILIEKVTPEIPKILLDIAICESKNKQFNEDGSVHMGKINPLDTGRFQINQKYWLEKSKELGFDIFTLEGNTKMALYIYEQHGTTPWNWSKSCWSK